MRPLSTSCSAILLSAAACAGSPPKFETSLSAPEERTKHEPLEPLEVTPRYMAHPTYDSQLTLREFLLALENGTSERLETLLAPGATVREESSGSGNSALPTLLSLARSWTGAVEGATSAGAAHAAAFGPAHIVEISPQSTDAWATVFVAGPPQVEGYWKIHLERRHDGQQVQEVIVPKSH